MEILVAVEAFLVLVLLVALAIALIACRHDRAVLLALVADVRAALSTLTAPAPAAPAARALPPPSLRQHFGPAALRGEERVTPTPASPDVHRVASARRRPRGSVDVEERGTLRGMPPATVLPPPPDPVTYARQLEAPSRTAGDLVGILAAANASPRDDAALVALADEAGRPGDTWPSPSGDTEPPPHHEAGYYPRAR